MTVTARLVICGALLATAIALWGDAPVEAQSTDGDFFVISDKWEVQFPAR